MVEIAPKLFEDAWLSEDEPGLWCVGGGVDYWGEDSYSVWEWFSLNWMWLVNAPVYPYCHKYGGRPYVRGVNTSTPNLLRLVREYGEQNVFCK